MPLPKILTIFALVIALFVSIGLQASEQIRDTLVGTPWKMERKTGLGHVATIWMFLDDGSGSAYQRVTRGKRVDNHNHKFTYTIEGNRIFIQEEIAREWEGLFGVTRWKLVEDTLVCDVKFRKEVIRFIPIYK